MHNVGVSGGGSASTDQASQSPVSRAELRDLENKAVQIRRLILQSVHKANAGHIGGPLSATDILVALYFKEMRIDPKKPDWEDRDRFILSKGHSSIAIYATLALRGYFPIEELDTFDAINSRLQGHPDMTKLPGLDMSSGSLGLGLSPAIGMALGARLKGKDFRSYVILGDGEIQEGMIWEAAFIASRYQLDNLTAILDYNKLQQYGWATTEKPRKPRITIEDPGAKFTAFGWEAIECDGHDMADILRALAQAKEVKGKPAIIIANTIKGYGISFMAGDYNWHAKPPNKAELEAALEELDSTELAIEAKYAEAKGE